MIFNHTLTLQNICEIYVTICNSHKIETFSTKVSMCCLSIIQNNISGKTITLIALSKESRKEIEMEGDYSRNT